MVAGFGPVARSLCGCTVSLPGAVPGIPNANGGQSPTFDCFAITRGGTHVVDSRKLDEAKKPSILVMLLERLGAQS